MRTVQCEVPFAICSLRRQQMEIPFAKGIMRTKQPGKKFSIIFLEINFKHLFLPSLFKKPS
jgi:hypothetical protein